MKWAMESFKEGTRLDEESEFYHSKRSNLGDWRVY